MAEPQLTEFANGEELAEALATRVAESLDAAVERDGTATLAVSGGSTPRRFFQVLSQKDIAWKQVTVTLVDERFVPPSSDRSNHRLVATHLLQNAAAFAEFVPLYAVDRTPEDAARDAAGRLATVKMPLDVAVLGMGLDGHTASWFPQSPQLTAVTDPNGTQTVLSAEAPGAGETRLTLTLPVVAQAALCVLHLEGNDKKRVYEEAMRPGPVEELPVRAILRKTENPLQVTWAP